MFNGVGQSIYYFIHDDHDCLAHRRSFQIMINDQKFSSTEYTCVYCVLDIIMKVIN